MIKVVIYKKKDKILGFTIDGHANFDDYGKDIVCSAVSIVAINTINTFEEILKKKNYRFSIDEKNRGFIKFDIDEDDNDKEDQLILKSFELAIKSLANEYDRYVRLSHKEVDND